MKIVIADGLPSSALDRLRQADWTIDNKQGRPSGQGALLAIVNDDMRQLHVGRMILYKEGVTRVTVGDDGLRARHDTAEHGDLPLVHRRPTPIGDHVPIDIGHLPSLVRYQRRQQCLGGPDAFELPEKLTQR